MNLKKMMMKKTKQLSKLEIIYLIFILKENDRKKRLKTI